MSDKFKFVEHKNDAEQGTTFSFFGKVSDLCKGSFTSKFFLGYDDFERKISESAISKFIMRIKNYFRKHINIKRIVSRSFENSTVFSYLNVSSQKILEKSLRYYGVMLFFFGIFVMAFSTIRELSRVDSPSIFQSESMVTILSCMIIVLFSTLLMTTQKSLASHICESRFLSFFAFDILCFDRSRFEQIKTVYLSHTLPVIAGMVLSLFATFGSIVSLFKFIMLVLCLSVIMRIPEAGVIFVFLAMPFLGDVTILTVVASACFSFAVKYIRNKRVFKIGLFDISVILFAFVVLFSGIISVNYTDSLSVSLVILLIIFFGFVISNTMKTSALIKKCINALIFSAAIISAVGVVEFVFEFFELASHNMFFAALENLIKSIPFGRNESYQEIIALIFPLMLAKHQSGVNVKEKSNALFSIALSGAFLIFTFDISVWLMAVCSVAAYSAILKPRRLYFIAGLILSFGVLFAVFPDFIGNAARNILSFTNFGEVAGVSDVSNKYALTAAREFNFLGAGASSDAVTRVFSDFFGISASYSLGELTFFQNFLLKFGIIGVISLFIMYILYLSFCTSFCYSFGKYDMKNKHYIVACAAAMTAVIAKGMFFPAFLSLQSLLCVSMIAYAGIAVKVSAYREYVPLAHDLPAIEENII